MKRGLLSVLSLVMTLLFISSVCQAGDAGLKKGLQQEVRLSHSAAKKGEEKEKKGQSAGQEIARLRSGAARIRADQSRLKDKFAGIEGKVESLGDTAVKRRKSMEAAYNESMQEYLSLIDGLPPSDKATAEGLDAIVSLPEKTLHKKTPRSRGDFLVEILTSLQHNQAREWRRPSHHEVIAASAGWTQSGNIFLNTGSFGLNMWYRAGFRSKVHRGLITRHE